MQDDSNYFEYFFNQLLNALEEKVPFGVDKEDIRVLSQNLIDTSMPMATDQASVNHIKTCAVVIAVFRELRKRMPMDECLEVIRYAFVDSLGFITEQTEQFLDKSSNPFSDIVAISRQKEGEYGDSFEFYRKRDDDEAYLLEVRKCFYCKLLTANHAPELMPIFCDFDTLWMKAIKPEKHGFKFERPETIGTNGEVCKFYFTKVERA